MRISREHFRRYAHALRFAIGLHGDRNSTQLLNINTTKFQVERETVYKLWVNCGRMRDLPREGGGATFGGLPSTVWARCMPRSGHALARGFAGMLLREILLNGAISLLEHIFIIFLLNEI